MVALAALIPKVFVYGIDPLGYADLAGYDTGTYDAGVYASMNWFVLGDATRGRLGAAAGNALATEADAEARADITCFVESFDVVTGKSRGLDSYSAGRCTVQLDATDRRFDPFSTSGTAYSPTTTGVQRNLFQRGRRMRIALVDPATPTQPQFWVWSGYVDTIEIDYADLPSSPYLRARVNGVDGFDILGRSDLTELPAAGAGETVGARIRRICARAGWITVLSAGVETTAPKFTLGDATLGRLGAASGNQLNPPTFTTVVTSVTNGVAGYGLLGSEGAVGLRATTLAQNSLTDIKSAVESEGGQVWINRAGQVQWTTRADLAQHPLKPAGRTAAPQA